MSTSPQSFRTIPRFDPRHVPIETRDSALPAIPADRLELAALRERLVNPPDWAPELIGDRGWLRDSTPRAAAVLIPIVDRDAGPAVILTERTAHLSKHAGEVAFPGGRRDPEDSSIVDTALREAEEEIGLERARVEVVAHLPDYLTGTGYIVTPVVGFVRPGFELRADPGEVAHVFEVPLAFLMNPHHHERRRVVHGEIDRHFYAMPWRCAQSEREHFIWGATAAMLRNLYRLLSA